MRKKTFLGIVFVASLQVDGFIRRFIVSQDEKLSTKVRKMLKILQKTSLLTLKHKKSLQVVDNPQENI
jgi:hypothetical protein